MKVAVIGTGYVGLTTGVALAYLGHDVIGIDKDPAKVEMLKNGESPIHEHAISDLLAASASRLEFTTDVTKVAEAEVILIAVGTPSRPNGQVDVTYVEAAAMEVAEAMDPGRSYVVVVKSTVPIGTSRRVARVINRVRAEVGNGDTGTVTFASNPEFLREGRALADTFYPDRIVVGTKHRDALNAMRQLYEPILDQSFTPPSTLPRPQGFAQPAFCSTDPTSAETIKYAANAFLAVKISYINEIAGLCDRIDADVTEVARGIGMDARIGPQFLGAGLGWGGSCFPKDTIGLINIAAEHQYTLPIVAAAREVNERQHKVVVEKLQTVLKVLRGRSIGVLGLAFKPGTDDVRYSPAIAIVKQLLELGASVRVHDPIAMPNARRELGDESEVEFVDSAADVAVGADALVLATEWSEYGDLNLKAVADSMNKAILVDGRNYVNPTAAAHAGLTYIGVGR